MTLPLILSFILLISISVPEIIMIARRTRRTTFTGPSASSSPDSAHISAFKFPPKKPFYDPTIYENKTSLPSNILYSYSSSSNSSSDSDPAVDNAIIFPQGSKKDSYPFTIYENQTFTSFSFTSSNQ